MLVGVISRNHVGARSSIALLGSEAVLRWAREWSTAMATPICGLGATPTEGCAPRADAAPGPTAASAPLAQGLASLAGPTTAPTIAANQPGRTSSNDVALRQVFFRRGDVLSTALQLSCFGTADESDVTAVLAHLERTGQRMERDNVFPESRELSIPVCPLGAPREIVVTVKSGDSKRLYDYFRKLADDKLLGGRWLFEHRPDRDGPRETPEGPNSRYFVDVFKVLNPNQNPRGLTPGDIRLPLRPQTVAIKDEPGANIETVEAFSAVQTPDEACSRSQDELTYPYDLVALLDTLTANARNRTEPPARGARIVILDSGLYVAQREETVFRRALYVDGLNLDAAAKLKRLDGQKPLLPKPTDAAHGTHVASVALGGPLFARIQAGSEDIPRIRVDPWRVKELRGGMVLLPADRIPDIFDQLQPRGPLIVNLSFGAKSTISPVKSRLGDNGPDFLFVVAAGNTNNVLGQKVRGGESIHVHFPASYGGPDNMGEANLITVAALYRAQGVWKRAPFSDHGAEYVEVGAPGCSIPVVHFDRDAEAWSAQPQRENGTSFAAPLVSFTAALISTERPDLSAAAIKARILAAADLNPHLVKEITDGRSLNVVKAVAVSQDVLQTDTQVLRGRLELRNVTEDVSLGPDDAFPVRCGGVIDLKVRDVVKIVPGFNTAVQSPVATLFPDVVYALRGERRKLKRFDCALSDDELAVHFRREGAVGLPAFRWGEVRDLVPRMR